MKPLEIEPIGGPTKSGNRNPDRLTHVFIWSIFFLLAVLAARVADAGKRNWDELTAEVWGHAHGRPACDGHAGQAGERDPALDGFFQEPPLQRGQA
jgi:hypothetical protein